ncbi:hypothetical protein L0F63_002558 [Massospora cicadina]|nr:hypothetical protein L0F63_002558 [Massospora cicadina]
MKRAAPADGFLPDLDLTKDYPIRFVESKPKRRRGAPDDPSFFSFSFDRKAQVQGNLVPKLLTVDGPERCTLEVVDERNKPLVCEGRLDDGEVDCVMYFDPDTNVSYILSTSLTVEEFVITELDENYIFGEALEYDEVLSDNDSLVAELEAALQYAPKVPNGTESSSAPYHKLASPRKPNASARALASQADGAPKPKPPARGSSSNSTASFVPRSESAPKPAAGPEPAAVKRVETRKGLPKSPAAVAQPAAANPAFKKAPQPSPRPASPNPDEDDFDLMDMIGQDADLEPERPDGAKLFDFDEDNFEEVTSEPNVPPKPALQSKAKPPSPKRPLVRKDPPAKRVTRSSSSGSSTTSSSGSSSSGSSSSDSDSTTSGSSSSSDSDSNRRARKPVKPAPAPKAQPAKSPSPANLSMFAEEDIFGFEEHDSDKQVGLDFGPTANASGDEFKASPITNADLPTTDEDEPAPHPPPQPALHSSDYSSDNDQRYAKVDLAFIDDDQFDIV